MVNKRYDEILCQDNYRRPPGELHQKRTGNGVKRGDISLLHSVTNTVVESRHDGGQV